MSGSDRVFGGGQVARFAASSEHPDPALRRSALAIGDTIGTMLAGCGELSARAARRAAVLAGAGSTPLFGSGETAGMVGAALANGVAASALDLDDGHTLGGSIHPGAAIVPALLAAADPGDQLEDLIAANLVAYEVAIRAGYLLWPEDRSHQAHMAGTPAAIGGAVGCARLRHLDPGALRRALEIGAAHTPIAALQFPQVKESLGWAAATAVGSALLAEAGFKDAGRGGDDAFGYRPHPPTPFDRPGSADAFVSSLGSDYEIGRTYFKPYGACRFVHTAADALLSILDEAGIGAEQVDRIEVATHREAAYLDRQSPSAIEEGQYSFPFALAALARDPGRFPLRITQETIEDAATAELAGRVSVSHDPDLDRHYPEDYPSRVRLTTVDGETYERQELAAWGSTAKPLSEADLRRKLLALAEPRLGEGAEAVWELLQSPQGARIGDLVELLGAARA
jgi:2-methylcitrate dehydratase PrpD